MPAIPHNLLDQGWQAEQHNDPVTAQKMYKQVLRQAPNHPDANFLYGRLMVRLRQPDLAVKHLKTAVRLKPNEPACRVSYAVALRDSGQLPEAMDQFERTIDRHPDYVEGYVAWGQTFLDAGVAGRAAEVFRRGLEQVPNDPDLSGRLAIAYSALGGLADAVPLYQHAIKARPDSIDLRLRLAGAEEGLGHFEAAREVREAVLELQADQPEAIGGIANLHLNAGRGDEALATLEPAIEKGLQGVQLGRAWARLCKKRHEPERGIAFLQNMLKRDDVAPGHRVALLFSLGLLLDDAGQFDQAFAVFKEANEMFPDTFNPESSRQHIDRLISSFTREQMALWPRSECASDRPVFIVGMPRSGTSLVEQIIASHPKAFGTGERDDIRELTSRGDDNFTLDQFIWNDEAEMTSATLTGIAEEYLRRLDDATGEPGAFARITDKMPGNYMFLGIINLLFPNAHVIHCMRDPRDVAVSCYTVHLSQIHSFATSLEGIGHTYLEYERIMHHWRDTLDIQILDLPYEELVQNQEEVSRRLIDFVGLDWDEACLRFFESKRVALTLSIDQVQQPIYTQRMGRWRHYEKHLTPLLEILADSDQTRKK